MRHHTVVVIVGSSSILNVYPDHEEVDEFRKVSLLLLLSLVVVVVVVVLVLAFYECPHET